MKKNTISQICMRASFWPAFIIMILSAFISVILFENHTRHIVERELARHELINQLLVKAATSEIIIGNEHALYVTLHEFIKKYGLDDIQISNELEEENSCPIFSFLKAKQIHSSWEIPGLDPIKYIKIYSTIDQEIILMPLITSLSIIILFVFASIIMFRSINKKLYNRIVLPLNQTLSCDGSNLQWFDKKLAADEIIALYDKTNDFIKTLHHQRDQIEQHNIKQAKYDVALQVAHDIRSPVLALETIYQLFPILEERGKEMITNITKRITQIANDILEKHNPDALTPPIKSDEEVKTPIYEIVKLIVEEKKAILQNKMIPFELELDDMSSVAFVSIPEPQISRILSNLIDNAIESIENSGTIKLNVRSDKSYVYLSLIDTGCGISGDYLLKIFEEGFSSNKPRGKGLGLPYAKKLIEQNGGKIHVESILGKGTKVLIALPKLIS